MFEKNIKNKTLGKMGGKFNLILENLELPQKIYYIYTMKSIIKKNQTLGKYLYSSFHSTFLFNPFTPPT